MLQLMQNLEALKWNDWGKKVLILRYKLIVLKIR